MAKEVSKYSIIIGQNDRDLCNRVNDELAKGWQPLGGPFLNKDGYPAQAVVQKD